MKTVIVYYSMSGNTALAAEKAASGLQADLLEIKPVKQYPDRGFRKFLWGGKSAVMAETPELQPYDFRADGYDQIVIGFPVWAGNIAPPIRTFLREHGNQLAKKRIAAFACQSGAGAEKAFRKLSECLGGSSLYAQLILIDPKDKPDKENDRAIEAFVKALEQ